MPLKWISQSVYAVSNHTAQNQEFWHEFIIIIMIEMKHDGTPKLSEKALDDVMEFIIEKGETLVEDRIQSARQKDMR